MRPGLFLLCLLFVSSGCTHISLERNTIQQASTLTDLQYQQVLDNLAMFACNQDAMAWHLKINGGTVQVTDQTTCGFLAVIPSGISDMVKALYQPSVVAQRGVVNQWNVVPAVDPDDLEPLNLAYQLALRPFDKEINRKIFDQICEISVKYNILLAQETVGKLLEHKEMEPKTPKPGETANAFQARKEEFEARKWDLKRKFEVLYKELDTQFDQLAKLSQPIKPEDIANYKKLDKTTPDSQARENLQKERIQQKLIITQYRVGVEDQIVKLIGEICDLPYMPRYPATGRPEHSPYTIAQIQDKIKALVELDEKFTSPWVCVGRKKDVPKCACYVGHYCRCGCECYVWVMPDQWAKLRDFTIAVLNIAPLEAQQIPGPFPGGGVTYSPTTSGGGR
jgi:hypothetical protein